MTAPFFGEIRAFGFTFAPSGWMTCSGQTLPIAQYSALFSILGTTYGGNGTTTFQLPNLNGRIIVHSGGGNPGPGLSPYVLGEQTGAESETLTLAQLGKHTHAPYARVQTGTANMHTMPQPGDYLTRFNASSNALGQTWNSPPLANAVALHASTIGSTGANQVAAHENRQPFLALNYCIAITGIFPSRN